ncbi:hypothetical protein ONE63_001616 [Megalurothrips usitatus]|uniref:Mediator of RNA polymerase II transcription subunit 26 n=1 Tax=Megalurothrips usitatus TaxID=439358 RepID=A0AAV7XH18_9NEOP|nr:hypothetical protein ONE63_001616 [Megalurothrips usitatus]
MAVFQVVDMAAVVEVISILERTPITKDALETTRLGKFINELRRKTKNENLAKRAKDLVRRWRDMILPTPEPVPAAAAPPGQQYNGAGGHSVTASRVISSSGHLSPGLPGRGNISPGLPPHGRHLNRSATVSPAMSLPSSDRSNTSPRPASRSSTPRPGDQAPVPAKPFVSASAVDPVPKTHATNKRLRKEDSPVDEKPPKKLKLNGLSTDPSSHGMTNSLGRPDIVSSRDGSRDSFSPHSEQGSNSCEVIRTVVPSEPIQQDSSKPTKRGRKKGSKNKCKDPDLSKDNVSKTSISSVGRTHRVKTTQELLADLQARNTGVPSDNVIPPVAESKASLTNCLLPGTRGGDRDALEISRNKTEHIAKFLRSQSDLELSNQEFPSSRDTPEDIKESPLIKEEPDPSDEISRLSKDVKSPAGSNSIEALSVERPISVQELRTEIKKSPAHALTSAPHTIGSDKTVEEILLRLPPIDAESIEWENSESPLDSPEPKTVSEDDVCRLHSEHIEGVNGVVNHGSQTVKDEGNDFREWHETVSRASYQGEMLHILPYVVID